MLLLSCIAALPTRMPVVLPDYQLLLYVGRRRKSILCHYFHNISQQPSLLHLHYDGVKSVGPKFIAPDGHILPPSVWHPMLQVESLLTVAGSRLRSHWRLTNIIDVSFNSFRPSSTCSAGRWA